MLWGAADENALPSVAIPFGNFLAILKARVKDINWTTKDVSMGKTPARAFDTREQFFRRKTDTIRWQLVVNPDSIVHGQQPTIDE
jgi:hypothetical protein